MMSLGQVEVLAALKVNPGTRKCFIFDLDGTIIFNNQFLSKEIENLLQDIHVHGHELIFATGRPLKDFKTVMPAWTHAMPLTLFSGGISLNRDEIIRSHAIERVHVEHIANLCLANAHRFVMDSLSHYYHPEIEEAVFGFLDRSSSVYRMYNLGQILEHQIYKILILELHTMDMFSEYAQDNNLLIKHHSYDECFDIVSSQCNKYLGVLPFVESFANEDVFVFGNDFNDLELLSHFFNSILFGNIAELQRISKINITYNDDLMHNLKLVIKTILHA